MKHNFSKLLFPLAMVLTMVSCGTTTSASGTSSTSSDSTSLTSSDTTSSSSSSSTNLPDEGVTWIKDVKTIDELDAVYTIKGVFVRTYAAEYSGPQGFYLTDETDSIYVFAESFAEQIATFVDGQTITVTGTYARWIAAKEQESAAENGYTGARQLVATSIDEVINTNVDIPSTGYKESTIEDIYNHPWNDNITSNIYKVPARIYSAGSGDMFNWYMAALNDSFNLRCYSNNNKTVHNWLEDFEGRYFNVLIAVHNAAMTSNKTWRIVPIAVLNELKDVETYQKDTVIYEAKKQFDEEYFGNVRVPLINVSQKIEGATISYTSNDSDVNFETTEEGITMCSNVDGKKDIEITIKVELNGKSYTEKIVATFQEFVEPANSLTVTQALEKELDTEMIVKGTVVQYLYNKPTVFAGVVIIDDATGAAIQVTRFVDDANNDITTDIVSKIEIGNKIYVSGKRAVYQFRQEVDTCKLIYNDYNIHDINYSLFNQSTTIVEMNNFAWNSELANTAIDPSTNICTIIYKMSLYVTKTSGSYPQYVLYDNAENAATDNLDLRQKLYTQSGIEMYSWIEPYVNQQVECYYMIRLAKPNNKAVRADGLLIGIVDGENVINK